MPHSTHKERRESTRFRPKDGTRAIGTYALGSVVNISMGGLCFRYMDSPLSRTLSNTIGLFLSSDDILIDDIEIRVVSDKPFSQNGAFSFSNILIRERAVQFLNLTVAQKKELEEFLLTKTHN